MNSVAENQQSKPSEIAHRLQPEYWLERYGDALYSYAWTRLRDRSAAEDLVQQTFLEAFKSRAQFEGEVSEKGWLFTIHRHNLIDLLRRKTVITPGTERIEATDNLLAAFEDSGLRRGKWKSEFEPIEFRSPDTELVEVEFWKIFHRCVSKLPAKIARVVLLRELDNLSAEEICSIAGISQSNFWVMCHRARIALQLCLKREWFQ